MTDLQKQIEEVRRLTRWVTALTWVVLTLVIIRIAVGILELSQ